MNKQKIINDPLYGFININSDFVYDIIHHRYMQRLRRIKQLGMSHLVYPGAVHTRFQHVLGAAHLMRKALQNLRSKDIEVSPAEFEASILAILMHDLGHGPYSHTLEHDLVAGISHEDISVLFMKQLNVEFDGRLQLAIDIFSDDYPKKFLHELVSSQLDMDRLDYLSRDSFYTGVSEGIVGIERIIKMLNVVDNRIVVEAKGIYSIEKFLIARRIMYWQVYLHKTVVSAEHLLKKIMLRARHLAMQQADLPASPALLFFLTHEINGIESMLQIADNDKTPLQLFADMDDYDIMWSIKQWTYNSDKILSYLSNKMLNRDLFRVEIYKEKPTDSEERIAKIKDILQNRLGFSDDDLPYLLDFGTISNNAYQPYAPKINILFNDGSIQDIALASDISNVSALSHTVTKYFLFYPKEVQDYL